MKTVLVVVLLFVSLFACAKGAPLWKVFCQGTPLYRGRADPIVNPGSLAQHSHKVFGGSAFDFGDNSTSEIDYYNKIFGSKCTTCTITIDNSVYWIPDLYYRWPNGSLSLVPNGGLTVYYPSRQGSGAQSNPKWKAIPPGLRIVAGSTTRRTYDPSDLRQKAISYACLSSTSSGPETGEFPTATRNCNNGLRAQIWFPMCWDGVHLDNKTDHFSHMAYPSGVDGGNCPDTHPVRIPGIFFEVLFSVDKFPHGNGVQPFVWSNGDPTGNGLHGDFLNGWDPVIMQQAIEDPSCDISNTVFGNKPENCKPFTPYVKTNNPDQSCMIEKNLASYEDLGVNRLLSHLPGCNPITNVSVKQCQGAWPQSPRDSKRRVSILSPINNKFWTVKTSNDNLAANTTIDKLSYYEMFTIVPQPSAGANLVGIQSEIFLQYMSDNARGGAPFKFNRWSPSGWEYFTFTYINGTGPTAQGTPATILANSNGQYLQIKPDGTIQSDAKVVNPNCIFLIVDPNAVVTDTRTSIAGFQYQVNNIQDGDGANGASSSFFTCFSVVLLATVTILSSL